MGISEGEGGRDGGREGVDCLCKEVGFCGDWIMCGSKKGGNGGGGGRRRRTSKRRRIAEDD